MTNLEAVREHLKDCPLLKEGRLSADILNGEAASYSVEAVPCEEVVRQYVDGSSQRQFLFMISAEAPDGEDIRRSLDGLAFFERLAAWIEAGGLPALGQGRRAQKMEAGAAGYVCGPGENTAQYQMQCRMLYYQGNGR